MDQSGIDLDPETALCGAFAVHAENARWLIDRQSSAIESLHQRAATLLGFSGVILAILPSVLGTIGSTSGHRLVLACWATCAVSAIALAFGAACSLTVILTRLQLDVGTAGIVNRWVNATSKSPIEMKSVQVQADYVNAYFGRSTDPCQSALMALRDQSQTKAQWLRRSMWSSAVGIILLGALLAMLVAGRV